MKDGQSEAGSEKRRAKNTGRKAESVKQKAKSIKPRAFLPPDARRATSYAPGSTPLSIAQVLSQAVADLTAHSMPNPRLDAEILLAHALRIARTGLYTRLQEPLSEAHAAIFQQCVQRRTRHEPLQYITGVQEFWSLDFTVDQRVLIPRPETEVLVEVALHLLGKKSCSLLQTRALRSPLSAPRLLDVGTGSGCIAIALAKELPEAEIWATDISAAALAMADDNAQRHGIRERIHLLQGDLFAPIMGQGHYFDVIVSNPPYILHRDLPTLQPEVRDWEPKTALDGGADGLDFYRRLLSEGLPYLSPGGWFVLEVGHGQGPAVLRLAREQSILSDCACLFDYADRERVIMVRKTESRHSQPN